eukprot:5921819-Amphidinium_carterae.1
MHAMKTVPEKALGVCSRQLFHKTENALNSCLTKAPRHSITTTTTTQHVACACLEERYRPHPSRAIWQPADLLRAKVIA